jgi:hypothetical protein
MIFRCCIRCCTETEDRGRSIDLGELWLTDSMIFVAPLDSCIVEDCIAIICESEGSGEDDVDGIVGGRDRIPGRSKIWFRIYGLDDRRIPSGANNTTSSPFEVIARCAIVEGEDSDRTCTPILGGRTPFIRG